MGQLPAIALIAEMYDRANPKESTYERNAADGGSLL